MFTTASQFMLQTDLPNDVVNKSIRFNDGDSPELTKTWGANETDSNHFTVSFWVKRCLISSGTHTMLQCDTSGGQSTQITFQSDDTMYVGLAHSGTGQRVLQTTQVFRDTTNWYHILLAYDSENGTNALKARLYVNGTEVTDFGTDQRSSIGGDEVHGIMDNSAVNTIGFRDHSGTSKNFLDGYLAHFHCIDGQTLAPSDFTQIVDGVCVPKTYTGSYGNNGFRLEFKQTGTSADASGIGADTSGNTNHFTSANLAASDVVTDTPENNFCTINSIYDLPSGWTFSEGNLKYTTTTNQRGFVCNQSIPLGNRVYWETRVESFGASDDEAYIGVAAEGITSGNLDESRGGGGVDNALVYAFSNYDNNVHLNSSTAAGTGPGQYRNSALPTVVGCAVDRVNHTIKWNLDGGEFSSEFTIPSTNDLYPFVGSGGGTGSAVGILNFGQDDTFAGAVSSNGITGGGGKFRHTVPAGYNALCSRNLNEPILSANPNRPENADDNFIPYSYTADNTDNKARTGIGFQPDLLWFKDRDTAFSPTIYDSSRGANKYLLSSSTGGEVTSSDLMSSFDSDGFTTQTDSSSGNVLNYSSDKYIVWSWKANAGTTTTNDASATGVGTIDSVYQANTDAGFSIVTYTGTGSAGTLAHGLSSAPTLIIVFGRSVSNSQMLGLTALNGWTHYFAFHTADGVTTDDATIWNDVAPTSTVFSVGTAANTNQSSATYVAYCFHDVEAYSKIGTYKGNSNADGTYINTGFSPAWVGVRKISAGESWIIFDNARDTFNVRDSYLRVDTTAAETVYSGVEMDFLSNGFKLRGSEQVVNDSSHTFIYLAFAKQPFKYSNAA